jgi:predicted ATPase/transcriptional regulator with XRE-family HTH domain
MSDVPPPLFASFGAMLRYLRRRARLTQQELARAAGYSESQISRLEQNQRRMDPATLLAVFVPALRISDQPHLIEPLLALAVAAPQPEPDANTAELPLAPHPRDTLAPSNLPARLTSFIGREAAIPALRQMISATRLVTLTGVGGVGKSSLALTVGAGLVSSFADGVWWVELAPLTDAALIARTTAAVFRLPTPHGQTDVEVLASYCQDRHLLLILDNCEHVVGACAGVAETLLRSCPRVHILTTSREALRIAGEVEWPVAPLITPAHDARPERLSADHAFQVYEAVQLFVERARATQPAFAWTNQTAALVAPLCAQLDGLPLAIELAAARLKGMTVGELAARLENRFHLLTGGLRTALPRHQTLRAAVDWSYDLLSEPERALLRRLAVFAGGWTLDALEAIAQEQPAHVSALAHPVDMLLQLVNKSMVVAETRGDGTRYRLLETIRQYAAEKLAVYDDIEAIRGLHFAYYLSLAEQSADVALVGRRLGAWLRQMDTELDNLRAALAWSREQADGGERYLRLAGALWLFWDHRHAVGEGTVWLEEALARGVTAPPALRARALVGLTYLVRYTAAAGRRTALAEEALSLCLQMDDHYGMAHCHFLLGVAATDRLDFPRVVACYEQGARLFRAVNCPLGTGRCLIDLANVLTQWDRAAQAIPLFEECLASGRAVEESFLIYQALEGLIFLDPPRGLALGRQEIARQRALGDPETLAAVLEAFGCKAIETGDPGDLEEGIHALTESLALWRELRILWSWAGGTARAHLDLGAGFTSKGEYAHALDHVQEAVRLYQQSGDLEGVGWSRIFVGWAALGLGDLALAFTSFRSSLQLFPDGNMSLLPYALVGVAEIARRQGDLARAGRLFGAAVQFRRHLNPRVAPLETLPAMQAGRGQLDDPRFAAAWAEGEAMPLAAVMAYVLDDV